MDTGIELRQLRYFVAVAEELHFGRAADRLHISQSPLSRAIRDLERQLDLVLFLRTTRRVELTPAGAALLESARRTLADVGVAVDDARRAARPVPAGLAIGFGPLSREPAVRIAEAFATARGAAVVDLREGVTPELLSQVAAQEQAAAVVIETPGAARRHGVRIDRLRDEPLLAALPDSHAYADAGAIPLEKFAADRVLVAREPPGLVFNTWLRATLRTHGLEISQAHESLSAPWDRRMLPVAEGGAVAPIVAEWQDPPIAGVVAVPFDPPLTLPLDLASPAAPGEEAAHLVATALRLRDTEQWLSTRAARTGH